MLANIRTAAYTAAFITFGCAHQTALAQIYDVANIQTIDLNKAAGYTRSRDGAAPIVARPDGGAYIQWASADNWNNGNRCTANGNVFVTEIDNTGAVVGADINVGVSVPLGIAATRNGFSYLLQDGDKLTLGTYSNGVRSGNPVTIMDHRAKENCGHYAPHPESFVNGLRFTEPDNGPRWGFGIPYLPEQSDMAFGGQTLATAIGHSNNFRLTRNPPSNDSHSGQVYLLFNPTYELVSGTNVRLPQLDTDHSLDRRIEHVDGDTFLAVRLNDAALDIAELKMYRFVNGQLTDNYDLTEPNEIGGDSSGLSLIHI